jgi:uncharacterized membrane protein
MIAGLILFLGIHSIRFIADPTRSAFIAKRGRGAWKGLYSLLSVLGFLAILKGYALARVEPTLLWASLAELKHLEFAMTLAAFVMLVAAYVPHNAIKAKLHHPMVLAVIFWALAHLLAKGTVAGVLLFGSFAAWAAMSLVFAIRRDSAEQVVYPPGRALPTLITLALGTAAWLGFAIWTHAAWLNVSPGL